MSVWAYTCPDCGSTRTRRFKAEKSGAPRCVCYSCGKRWDL